MIPSGFRPMLSGVVPEDLNTLRFPLLVSPKLDGIRCIMFGGVAYSRKLKPIPNEWVQQTLNTLPDGLDGELIVGDTVGAGVFNRTASGVMSTEGRPDFAFLVFDYYNEEDGGDGFEGRLQTADALLSALDMPHLHLVPHTVVYSVEELVQVEETYVSRGYEGIMIRDPDGPYKKNRSTTREGYLLKMKRFHDAEAEVVDFVERLHNGNDAQTDERGYAKRSSAKAGKVPMDTLGALVCAYDGVTFELGTGFNDEQRKAIWENREAYQGRLAKFKYQEFTPDGKPRFPVWLGWRYEADL